MDIVELKNELKKFSKEIEDICKNLRKELKEIGEIK